MKISADVYLLASGALGTGMSHPNDCNVFAVDCGGGEYALIDAGVGQATAQLISRLELDGINPQSVKFLFLTHAHLDHSGGAAALRDALNLKVYASLMTARFLEAGNEAAISLDAAKRAGIYPAHFEFRACRVDQTFGDGELLQIGNQEVEVIVTPGHAQDAVCYLFRTPQRAILFSGDTVFCGGKILISSTYDCDLQQYIASLRKLAAYHIDALYPGHQLWSETSAHEHLKAATAPLDQLLLPPNLL